MPNAGAGTNFCDHAISWLIYSLFWRILRARETRVLVDFFVDFSFIVPYRPQVASARNRLEISDFFPLVIHKEGLLMKAF